VNFQWARLTAFVAEAASAEQAPAAMQRGKIPYSMIFVMRTMSLSGDMDPGPADHLARLTARLLLQLFGEHRWHLRCESRLNPGSDLHS
jgi:hypothetical protein